MQNDFQSIANMLMNSPNGAKIAKNFGKFKQIIDSPEGKEVIAALAGSGTDVIKQAAEAALANDKDRAMALLSNIMATPDGAKIASKIISIMGE